ncbi:asparaginyl-tRNA synthetase [Ardenticatena maritima]|uniref:Asparagine--tRNA ligase n=1 Tax=Ardenticatena maritima TaxID=872965 RepID=A0A0M9UD79_9CHLR|nr:asparagine--tRNA ligase [Ardenticatena maritima]KPL86951.1 asparagine--tRNA ligase [Ardenticatena maritima]GAP63690.1 asparaginyl-tRNA synthetase [Ardenticatena maritima]
MAEWVRIRDIGNYEGQTVTLKGWLYLRTDKGRLKFLRVRDGSGVIQAVVFKKNVPPEAWEAADKLTQESSLIVTGTVRADERAPGGYELDVSDLEVVHYAEPDYPIQPKEHGVGFLMQNRHLWIRSPRQATILRIRATVIRAIRDWLDSHDFVNVDTPILTPAAVEGTTTLFETDYFGKPAYLSQSGQLYNEANIFALGKVYCFGPTFRAEKSKTRRHLTEFWMVEPEMAFATLEDVMDVGEQMVSYVVQTVLEKHRRELEEVLERDVSVLEKITPPFPRISYDEAVEILHANGFEDFPWGEDFGAPHETTISSQFEKPVFVYHYPTKAKAFYMEEVPGRPEVCRSVDLLAPEGYGEIIGGGQRIASVELLEQRLREHNLPREAYEWYIDLRRYGSVPHAGFGLGVERTLAWICKLPHVRETIAFPRMLDHIYP